MGRNEMSATDAKTMSAEEQDALQLIDDAIVEWTCDYESVDLPDVLMSANTLEPIFALARHQIFTGSVIVYFRRGRPNALMARNAEDSFEDLGGGRSRLKT
jgi:hypothetical protein